MKGSPYALLRHLDGERCRRAAELKIQAEDTWDPSCEYFFRAQIPSFVCYTPDSITSAHPHARTYFGLSLVARPSHCPPRSTSPTRTSQGLSLCHHCHPSHLYTPVFPRLRLIVIRGRDITLTHLIPGKPYRNTIMSLRYYP